MKYNGTFFVEGEPKPQPRPRATCRHGSGGRVTLGVFDPGTADVWKRSVRQALFYEGLLDEDLDGPISLTLRFHLPRPASHHKCGDRAKPLSGRAPTHHIGKPDTDNLAKSTLDALTDAGLWHDDAQVCSLHVEKFYNSGRVGCEVIVKQFDAEQSVRHQPAVKEAR
jgi:Holliday junction resolvase RusA-like endonuclease